MADSKVQMFIGNLPWSIRARHLEEFFGEHGEVTDAFVAYKGRRSRGFGFVTMAKPADASKAQAALDGKKVGEGEHEREMRVTFAKERSAEDQAKADAAKAAAAERRAERSKKAKEGTAKEGGGGAESEKKKPANKNKKRPNKKKGGGEASAAAEASPDGEVAFNTERKDQSGVKVKSATKGGFAAPKGKPAPKKALTEEEKKARGLLYDTSKASAVREEEEEDDEGAADFAGGDPFAGL